MYPFKLPKLEVDYDVCEPIISTEAMKLHHQKHHKSYVDKLNDIVYKDDFLRELNIEKLISKETLDKVDEKTAEKLRNFGGGHFNHTMFFNLLTSKKNRPGKMMTSLINNDFGNFDDFIDNFKEKSKNHFGSGWCWAIIGKTGLEIITTKNQDNPINFDKCKPIFCIDLWEHAYYLDHQNRKQEYIDGIIDYINWKEVENHILEAENV